MIGKLSPFANQRSNTLTAILSNRHPSSFATRRLYADYVRSEIKPGFRVRACQSYQDVNEGDEGVYRQHNHSTPPVQVEYYVGLNIKRTTSDGVSKPVVF